MFSSTIRPIRSPSNRRWFYSIIIIIFDVVHILRLTKYTWSFTSMFWKNVATIGSINVRKTMWAHTFRYHDRRITYARFYSKRPNDINFNTNIIHNIPVDEIDSSFGDGVCYSRRKDVVTLAVRNILSNVVADRKKVEASRKNIHWIDCLWWNCLKH